MTIKAMIKENNRLREQMTPDNKDYFEDIVVYFRTCDVDQTESEQLLLALAHQLLEAQEQGIQARQLFGPNAEEYSRNKVQILPKKKTIEGIQYYVMIPWVALTMFFFMESFVGFVAQWLGGSMDTFNRISLLSLIVIAIGSILLMEAVTKLLNRKTEQEDQVQGQGNSKPIPKPNLNLRTIGIYVVVTLIIMMIGYTFRNLLPVFTIQPWVSLLIAVIGLVGWRFIFKRK
ncbi:DUF1129 family protein [Paenibacillus macquariensis]|uniref:Uncharacterized membrane-anchored protein n=1 Tax=Paenibacillus macquariensis TaxID=948756 RepID=A0ABY1KDP1_9BACL|nr:DUF1129 family protein [Paenibacillus macquariensis]MEC0093447.1 DUF1129 family protein [Paenibacillus macquariensis]OAB26314.1 hypothetical protein PMSM_27035 [Paenibacillus macquariensis subsp. macquariensis]SIR67038.1 Uncharacterized membrane-anchored protein [Paenibacillus macquariensis]